jgi:Putative GTP-binding controlling metal-binding
MLPPMSRHTHAAQRRYVGDAQLGGDLVEAAANLFYHLCSRDGHAARTIAVAPIPESGIGEAMNDRLRAAASRETPARPHSIVAYARASSRAISRRAGAGGPRRSSSSSSNA